MTIRIGMVAMLLMLGWGEPRLQAQASITDGTTIPSIAPGAPAGSYALSKFETVNVYNGHLNFTLPLLKASGRGEAGYTISLPIERSWRIESHVNNNAVINLALTPGTPGAAYWGTGWTLALYTPGIVVARSVIDTTAGTSAKCPAGTVGQGYTYYLGQTLTRLTYIEGDGTEHELRDTVWNGQPQNPYPGTSGCTSTPDQGVSRGKVFQSNDATSMTFVADSTVYDKNTTNGLQLKPNYPVDGWLLFRNGIKYRFSGSSVSQIEDRNGNVVTLCYSSGGGCAPSGADNVTITDSLGRQIHIQYATSPAGTDTIQYPGFSGTTRTISVQHNQLSAALSSGQSLQLYTSLFSGVNTQTSQFNPVIIQSVTLPDNSKYNLTYNAYAELKRVVLPTGGAFEYDYPYETSNPPQTPACSNAPMDPYGCVSTIFINDPSGGINGEAVFRRTMKRRVLPDGVNKESETQFIPLATGGIEVDTFDSSTNQVSRDVHSFYGPGPYPQAPDPPSSWYAGWSDGREYETDRFLSASATTPAEKTVNTWGSRACATGETCWWASYAAIPHDENICQTNIRDSANNKSPFMGMPENRQD